MMAFSSVRSTLLRLSLLLVVAATVVPLGAVLAPAVHVAAFLAALAGILAALLVGENPQAPWTMRLGILIAGGLVAYVVWQISPALSGDEAAPIWAEAGALIDGLSPTVSVAPGSGRAALIPLALPFMVFVTAVAIARTDEAGERLVTGLLAIGLAFAVFGLLQRAVTPDMILFSQRTAYIGTVTGTFINRNTAATFLGVTLVVQVARLGAVAAAIDWRSVLHRLLEPHGLLSSTERRFAWTCAGAVVVLLALLMTLSRGGIVATFAALAVLLPILQIGYASKRRSRRGQWRWLAGSLASWAVLGLMMVLFGGRTLMRIQVQGTEDARFCLYSSLVRAIGESLPYGRGFGAFPETFPAYRDPACTVDGIWERGHNVFLEGMLGLGWVFVAALALGMVVLLAGYVRGVWKRRRYRWAGAAGIAVLLLVTSHGLLDFSVQIPGMAVYTAAMLGVLTGLALGETGFRTNGDPSAADGTGRSRRRRGSPAAAAQLRGRLSASEEASPPQQAPSRPQGEAETGRAVVPARSSLLGRLLLLGASAAFLIGSGAAVLEDSRFRGLDMLGSAVWHNAVIPGETLGAVADRAVRATEGTCRPDVVKAAMLVAIAHLDRQHSAVDYAAWESAVLAARQALLKRLRCVPGDGDAWARLALVESEIADDPNRRVRLLAMSQRTAPAEPGAIAARFAAWRTSRARHFSMAHDLFVQDLRLVLTHYRLERIRNLIEPLPPSADPYILEAAKDLSYARARRLGRFDVALPRPRL